MKLPIVGGIPTDPEEILERYVKPHVEKTAFYQAHQAALSYVKHLRELAKEDEEAAKEEAIKFIENSGVLPKYAVRFLRENAGSISVDWLLGVVVVVFVATMLLPMMYDQINTASASMPSSDASLLQKIPSIIVLVIVIAILMGAFYYRRQ